MAEEKIRVWYEEIPIDKIDVQENVRTEVGDVSGLMTSLDQSGLLHPIGLYVSPDSAGRYVLRFGHRRLEACRKLGWTKVPAMISNKPITDEDFKNIKLENFSENKNRSDTSPVEDGRLFISLQNEYKMSFSEISAKTGASVSYIRKAVLTFAKTPKEYRNAVGYISAGSRKKGKFSQDMVSVITSKRLDKIETKKIFDYVKSHDEASLAKVRLILRLMEGRSGKASAMDFEQAKEKVEEYKVFSVSVTVKRAKAEELCEKYDKSLNNVMVDILTGKIAPVKGLVYKESDESKD